MCGLVNKRMSTQEVLEELTQTCIQLRDHLISDQFSERDKEAIIIKHIKQFENVGGTICDFEKGNDGYFIIRNTHKLE